MNSVHLTRTLAEEHRADLLRRAEQHRRVRTATAGRTRGTVGTTRRAGVLGALRRTIRRTHGTPCPQPVSP
jgi:hypothetical protein